jgi:Domain of unknown function (DUF4136)
METLEMPSSRQWSSKRLVTAAAFVSLVFLVGCDEHVQITRDHDIRIPKHATWAWRPAEGGARYAPPPSAPNSDNRPVISRDTMNPPPPPPQGRGAGPAGQQTTAEDDVVRQRVKTAIEQTLASKGFQQVDPAQAEFLVDYKFAVRRLNERVPAYGGYPGLVCGPFGCWYGGYGPAWAGYENIHFREGTIVFDWLQRDTKHLVYRAIGEKPVQRDAFSLTQSDINSLTHKLLSELKPGK